MKKKEILVELTECELEELRDGKVFNWQCRTTDDLTVIDVRVSCTDSFIAKRFQKKG